MGSLQRSTGQEAISEVLAPRERERNPPLDQDEEETTSPVGLTPEQTEERPEAIHAGDSSSGREHRGRGPMLGLSALQLSRTATPAALGASDGVITEEIDNRQDVYGVSHWASVSLCMRECKSSPLSEERKLLLAPATAPAPAATTAAAAAPVRLPSPAAFA